MEAKDEVRDLIKNDAFLNQYSLEDIIDGVRELVENDLKAYIEYEEHMGMEPNRLVVACLEASINNLGDASVNWYASTK